MQIQQLLRREPLPGTLARNPCQEPYAGASTSRARNSPSLRAATIALTVRTRSAVYAAAASSWRSSGQGASACCAYAAVAASCTHCHPSVLARNVRKLHSEYALYKQYNTLLSSVHIF